MSTYQKIIAIKTDKAVSRSEGIGRQHKNGAGPKSAATAWAGPSCKLNISALPPIPENRSFKSMVFYVPRGHDGIHYVFQLKSTRRQYIYMHSHYAHLQQHNL